MERKLEQTSRAELRISTEEARGIAGLLRYAVGLNTTAGLLSPTERRLTTPTYLAVELAARILEGASLEEAAEASESVWTGSLERDHQRSLELVCSQREALQDVMPGLMDPERFARYLEISEEQFLELIKSGMYASPNEKSAKKSNQSNNCSRCPPTVSFHAPRLQPTPVEDTIYYMHFAYTQEDDDREGTVGSKRWALALADGTCVAVREIEPGDAGALQRLVGRSSERTVRLRYFGPMKQLSDELARRFAEVDGVDRYALVALDPQDEGEIIAVVRYEREDGRDAAEYAALVEDRFQNRGLGTSLTRALIEAARERDIEHLHAYVLPENRAMFKLLRGLGLPERARRESDFEYVEVALSPDGWG